MLSEFQMRGCRRQDLDVPVRQPALPRRIRDGATSSARARASNPPPDAESRPGEPTPSFYYTASGNTLFVGLRLPGALAPGLLGRLGDRRMGKTLRYVKDVRFGSSSQFGTAEPGSRSATTSATTDGKKWGSWLLDLDYLSKRGPGVGVDFAYEQPDASRARSRPPTSTTSARTSSTGSRRPRIAAGSRGRHRAYLRARRSSSTSRPTCSATAGYYPTYFEDEFKQTSRPRPTRI